MTQWIRHYVVNKHPIRSFEAHMTLGISQPSVFDDLVHLTMF